jgi:hypothetical protein
MRRVETRQELTLDPLSLQTHKEHGNIRSLSSTPQESKTLFREEEHSVEQAQESSY